MDLTWVHFYLLKSLFLYYTAMRQVLGLGDIPLSQSIYDARHEKTDLKVFVIVIANPSLGMTSTTEYNP